MQAVKEANLFGLGVRAGLLIECKEVCCFQVPLESFLVVIDFVEKEPGRVIRCLADLKQLATSFPRERSRGVFEDQWKERSHVLRLDGKLDEHHIGLLRLYTARSSSNAMRRDDVIAAARGCSVIVHAVNPKGYRQWAELVLPMLDNTIAAAASQGATIVLPGTVYNFGPDVFRELHEESPQRPLTRKGSIRVELERRLRSATAIGVRTIVVRADDFFGPKPCNNWIPQGMVKPGRAVTVINLPGRNGIGHQWSYLPDVARTIVELLARRESLEPFAAFHMAGHWDPNGLHMAEAICRVVGLRGGRAPKLRAFPWWLLVLASPFFATFREMREMRYLWNEPVRMTNDKLKSVLGEEPHTPLDQAIESTLHGMGCLDLLNVTPPTGPKAGVAIAVAGSDGDQ